MRLLFESNVLTIIKIIWCNAFTFWVQCPDNNYLECNNASMNVVGGRRECAWWWTLASQCTWVVARPRGKMLKMNGWRVRDTRGAFVISRAVVRALVYRDVLSAVQTLIIFIGVRWINELPLKFLRHIRSHNSQQQLKQKRKVEFLFLF